MGSQGVIHNNVDNFIIITNTQFNSGFSYLHVCSGTNKAVTCMFKKYNKCKVIDDVKIIKNVTMCTHIQQTCTTAQKVSGEK